MRVKKATRTLKYTYMILFCDISLACDQLKNAWELMPTQAHVMMAHTNIDESLGQQMRFGIMSVP
jgi:thioredoxin-like negative regulator of GroEL